MCRARQRRGSDPDDVPQLPTGGQPRSSHAWFENFWDTSWTTSPATVVEIMHKALADDSDPHKIRGM
jgi:hypothetical protein